MNPTSIEANELKRLINPNWHAAFQNRSEYEVRWVDARQLLVAERFDLGAKTLLARALRERTDLSWPLEVYRAHLDKWSRGTFIEGDQSGKEGFDRYYRDLVKICEDFATSGYDASRSIIPVSKRQTIHDGAHRTAASIDLGINAPVVESDAPARRYGYEFFRSAGLRDEHADAMALEFVERSPNAYVAYLFPVDGRRDDEAIERITEVGSIFYTRKLSLSRNGVHNLIAQIYRDEPWVGSASNGFAGVESHVKRRYVPGQEVQCVFFLADDLNAVVEAKSRIRDLYDQGNYPVHINDTHEEVVRVGRQILSETGRHFLDHGKPTRFADAHDRLVAFKKAMASRDLDPRNYMLDSSFVLAMYGLRNARDVDYLHVGDAIDGLPEEYQSHNEELAHYPHELQEMLCHPRHHFFYNGVKIASLSLVAAMKRQRGESKDERDLDLIDRLLEPPSLLERARTEAKYFVRTIPHRLGRARLVIFLWLPSGVQPTAKKWYRKLFKRDRGGSSGESN